MENKQPGDQSVNPNEESIFSPEEFSLKGYDKHIRQARNAIFAVAGLLVINLVILCFSLPDGYEYLWLDFSIWGVFIAGFIWLGFYTKKKPYYAIIGALCLYAAFIALNAVLDITTLYKGLLFKIITVVVLFKGINDAKEAQELQRTFGQ
ncbi:MAG: hypothetical protein H7X88_04635 [Gloeobacteraceae cyanobacterium ES-bin-316]|nr:hypothetical protein [Ferruginibacter sp.]